MFFFKKKTAHHITVLPHSTLCPKGEIVPAHPGKSLVENLLEAGVEIAHSCQMQCSCTTCHVYVMEGSEHLSVIAPDEAHVLKQANDQARWSRLGCQAVFEGGGDVVIELRS